MIAQTFDENGLPSNVAPKSTRAQWLEDRKKQLGASDVPAILGLSPWASAWEVFADKTDRLEPWSGNEATRAGQLFEPAVLDKAEQELGPLERNVRIIHPSLPLAATLDARVIETLSPVEAKTTGIVGPVTGDWGEALTDQVPDYYLVQVHTQLLVTGAELAYLFALIAGRGVVKYQIERSDKLCERLGNICADWWQKHVVNGEEPSRDRTPALEVVKRMRRQTNKRVTFDMAGLDLIIARDELKTREKQIAAQIKDCEAQILLALGDAEAADLPDGSELTFFETTRKAHQVKESTFRQIRIKKAKGK